MKQAMLMTCLIVACGVGAVIHPFWGIFLYYTFAVLRPEYLWFWALPNGMRWSLIAACVGIFGVILSLPRILAGYRWNPVATLLVIFAALVMLSTLTAVDTAVAQRWAIEYAKIFLMAVLLTAVLDRTVFVKYIGWMILLAIGYIAWHVNSLYLFEHRLDIFHRGYGWLDNNGAGLILAMGVPFAYAYACGARHWAVKAGCVFAAALMVHGLLMSYSRGAMLAALVGGLWLLIHHRPRWQTVPVSVVAVVAVLFMAGDQIRDRFMSIQDYQTDGSSVSRMESWGAAWAMAWDHPVTGVGVRNANLLSQNYGADQFGRTIHSQYFQIAADCGIPAMIVFITMCALAIWNLRVVRRRVELANEDDDDDPPDAPDAADNDDAAPDEDASIARPKPDPLLGPLALGMQTSLIIFCFGGLFLSLEAIELFWLLVVLAGALPGLVRDDLEAATGITDVPDPPMHTDEDDQSQPLKQVA